MPLQLELSIFKPPQSSIRLNQACFLLLRSFLFQGLEETFVGLTKQMMSVFPDGGVAKKSMALSGAGPGEQEKRMSLFICCSCLILIGVDEGASSGQANSGGCGC